MDHKAAKSKRATEDEESTSEPMRAAVHRGEIRRNPSTDEKKARRQQRTASRADDNYLVMAVGDTWHVLAGPVASPDSLSGAGVLNAMAELELMADQINGAEIVGGDFFDSLAGNVVDDRSDFAGRTAAVEPWDELPSWVTIEEVGPEEQAMEDQLDAEEWEREVQEDYERKGGDAVFAQRRPMTRSRSVFAASQEEYRQRVARISDLTAVEVGTRVSYQDLVSDRREGTIIYANPYSDSPAPYTVLWDDGTKSTTDLAQLGWSLAPVTVQSAFSYDDLFEPSDVQLGVNENYEADPGDDDDDETAKEATMSADHQREAQLLAAIPTVPFAQRQALMDELNAIRQVRRAQVAGEREVALANAVVRDTLTPVEAHSFGEGTDTDWLATAAGLDTSDPTQKMVVEASMWFRNVDAEVRADHAEFIAQADGVARRCASSFLDYDGARLAFLTEADRLRTKAGVNTDLPEEENAAELDARVIDPTDAPEVFDNFVEPESTDADGDGSIPHLQNQGHRHLAAVDPDQFLFYDLTPRTAAAEGAVEYEGKEYFQGISGPGATCAFCGNTFENPVEAYVLPGEGGTGTDILCRWCAKDLSQGETTASKRTATSDEEWYGQDREDAVETERAVREDDEGGKSWYGDSDYDAERRAEQRMTGEGSRTAGDGYHHDNGEKHDHEAKAGGSKESARSYPFVAVTGKTGSIRVALHQAEGHESELAVVARYDDALVAARSVGLPVFASRKLAEADGELCNKTKTGGTGEVRYCSKEAGHEGGHVFDRQKTAGTSTTEVTVQSAPEPQEDYISWGELGGGMVGEGTENEPQGAAAGSASPEDLKAASRGERVVRPFSRRATGAPEGAENYGKMQWRIVEDIGQFSGRPLFTLQTMPADEDNWAYGVWEDYTSSDDRAVLENLAWERWGPSVTAARTASKTAIADAWSGLRPGDRIRVGFEGEASNGTFVRLEQNSDSGLYGDAPVVVYTDDQGREQRFIPARSETPRAARESARRNQRNAMPNPVDLGVKVGDIFVSSWGYDQTNVNFYEVTRLTAASVEVREVSKNRDQSSGPPTDYVTPRSGSYIGEPMVKRLQSSGRDGRPYLTINSVQTAFLWDGRPAYETTSGWGH